MMFTRILVPTDGSDSALAAHKLAISIARKHDSHIVFMHALETVKLMSIVSPFEVCGNCQFATEAATRMAHQLLDDAVIAAGNVGIMATAVFVEGRAVPSVLEVARKHDVDLIVVGSHGRGGISGALLGTVAEGVLRHAAVPVLLARLPVSAVAAESQGSGVRQAVRSSLSFENRPDHVAESRPAGR